MKNFELWQGNCLEIMKNIPDKSVDLVLTDPPYGTTACKWDSVIPLEPMWKELKRITKTNSAIVLFGSEPFSSALRMSNIKSFKYDWIWDKVKPSGHLNAKIMPMKQHEIISVFCYGRLIYNPIMVEQKERVSKNYLSNKSDVFGEERQVSKITNLKYPKSIITESNASQKGKVHPTQKPVALMEYLIKTYSNEGMTVLDFTMGSGTTGVACGNTNRSFIGIELDEGYFGTAKNRIEDAYKDYDMLRKEQQC